MRERERGDISRSVNETIKEVERGVNVGYQTCCVIRKAKK
jgi:hypothetical protein